MNFQPLTEQLCVRYLEDGMITAQNVADRVASVQDRLRVFRGSLADGKAHPTDEIVPDHSIVEIADFGQSYFLDGLCDVTFVFSSKINHLLVRKCSSVQLDLVGGTISGIDVLQGTNVMIASRYHNSTNLEEVDGSQLQGLVDEASVISISHSNDVSMNGNQLPINMFLSVVLTLEATRPRVNSGAETTLLL